MPEWDAVPDGPEEVELSPRGCQLILGLSNLAFFVGSYPPKNTMVEAHLDRHGLFTYAGTDPCCDRSIEGHAVNLLTMLWVCIITVKV